MLARNHFQNGNPADVRFSLVEFPYPFPHLNRREIVEKPKKFCRYTHLLSNPLLAVLAVIQSS